jgi:hypothetical protein
MRKCQDTYRKARRSPVKSQETQEMSEETRKTKGNQPKEINGLRLRNIRGRQRRKCARKPKKGTGNRLKLQHSPGNVPGNKPLSPRKLQEVS